MTILDQQRAYINQFFESVDQIHESNKNLTFSHLSIKRGDDFYLIQAALTFNTAPPSLTMERFQSENILAGTYGLSELGVDARGLVDALLLGKISTPHGDLHFPGNDVGTHGTHYEPFSNNIARIGVFLAHGSSTKDVKLGYRIIDQGRVAKRSAIEESAMHWTENAERQYGAAEIVVPPAAVIHCFVSYRGVAQHFGWIADPTKMQNPRRSVYTKFEGDVEILTEFLTRVATKGRDGRDLEAGVAWLLWMLGFSVAHLGGTGRIQDAADLIATTPKGDFAVIECTTGLLKAENKLPLLVSRVEQVRSGIVASNNKHLRVLPIIVTSKTRAEVGADIEQAERLGILVVTKEDLQRAIVRTLIFANPEKTYDESWEAVETAKAKYQSQAGGLINRCPLRRILK